MDIKKEIKILSLLLVISIVLLKIIFYNESFLTILRVVFSFFWLFVIPGYILTYKFKFDFAERLIVGTAIAAGLIGLLSYIASIIGVHSMYHAFILPVIIILAVLVVNCKKIRSGVHFLKNPRTSSGGMPDMHLFSLHFL